MSMSRGGYIKIERGENQLTTTTIRKAAEVFGVRDGEIIQDALRTIPVMGRIGAGAEIEPEFEQTAPEGLFQVESPIPLPEGMIGLEVIGDSMYPRYDEGDILIVSRDGTSVENLANGDEAALMTADGRRFVKRIRRETGGLWTLESHNAPPIYGVEIKWASRVEFVLRGKVRVNGGPKQV